MRLCDVCKEPDPFKRQLAVGRIAFERTDSTADVPKYKSYDICLSCLTTKLPIEIIKVTET